MSALANLYVNGDGLGDGFDDLLVGDARDEVNGEASGAAYVIYGQRERGSDAILGSSGADILSGGSGDDQLVIDDASFDYLDGGNGTDTLRFANQNVTLDLTQQSLNTQIKSIEKIDLTGGNDHDLSLAGDAVREMSSNNRLIIDADSGDAVHFDTVSDSWTTVASSELSGFVQYTDGIVDVFITHVVGVTIDGVV